MDEAHGGDQAEADDVPRQPAAERRDMTVARHLVVFGSPEVLGIETKEDEQDEEAHAHERPEDLANGLHVDLGRPHVSLPARRPIPRPS